MVKSAASKTASSLTINPYESPSDKAKRLPQPPQSPTKSPRDKKPLLQVTNVFCPDGVAFGWFWGRSYDVKEQLKALANKNGENIYIGGVEFKSFINLTVKWIKECQAGNLLWVMRIDEVDASTDWSFPLSAHKAYANKVVRAIVAHKLKTLAEIEITPDLTLTESHMEELNHMFGEVTGVGNNVRDALLEEFIAEAEDDLEQLI